MPAERLKPIYSSRADDPSVDTDIDRFVVGLAERIDLLQDSEADGNLRQLAARTTGLIAEASAAGFEALAAVAKALEAACLEDDAKAARERLIELSEIAQRIRLGHKGAI